jgi:hypothetical protein
MVIDAAGTEIKQGDVITWCGRQSSTMFLSVGVVRDIESHQNQYNGRKVEAVVTADRLGFDQEIKHQGEERYKMWKHYYRRVKLTVPLYITVTGMNEDTLKKRFPFEEQLELLKR